MCNVHVRMYTCAIIVHVYVHMCNVHVRMYIHNVHVLFRIIIHMGVVKISYTSSSSGEHRISYSWKISDQIFCKMQLHVHIQAFLGHQTLTEATSKGLNIKHFLGEHTCTLRPLPLYIHVHVHVYTCRKGSAYWVY